MQFTVVPRHHIDTQKWDACLAQAPNNLIYAQSWYLDAATNKRWEAVVWGDYQAVMPLPVNRKLLGWKQVYVAPLTQQLGIYAAAISNSMIADVLQLAQSWKYARFVTKVNAAHFQQNETLFTARTNYILPLSTHYDALHAAYHKTLRKRLRQAAKVCLLRPADSIVGVIDFYKEHLGSVVPLAATEYQTILKIFECCWEKDALAMYKVVDADDTVLAMGIFFLFGERVYNVFGASSEQGKKTYAMHFLLDAVIREHHHRFTYFDFEGSDIPGVANFFKSFGPEAEIYGELIQRRI